MMMMMMMRVSSNYSSSDKGEEGRKAGTCTGTGGMDPSIIRLTLPGAEEGERSNARRQSQTISGLAALSPSAVQRPERNHNT